MRGLGLGCPLCSDSSQPRPARARRAEMGAAGRPRGLAADPVSESPQRAMGRCSLRLHWGAGDVARTEIGFQLT